MKSAKSVCITNRNLNHILEAMLHNWCVKCIVTLGAVPGPGLFEFGQEKTRFGIGSVDEGSDEGAWVDETSETPPNWTHDGSIVPELGVQIQSADTGALGRSQLVTLSDAKEVAGSVARKAVNEYEHKLRAQMDLQGGSYRCWLMIQGSKKLMAAELERTYEDLAKATLGRTKRVGVQCISTRRKKLPSYGGFQFSGKFAFRQFQGRPLLPEAEWIRRYRARKRKAKAAAKARAKPKAPHVVEAEETNSPRPDTWQQVLQRKLIRPKPRGRPPIKSSVWIERYRARKKKWNSKRKKKNNPMKPVKVYQAKHQRPPHILHLKCKGQRPNIYAQSGVELAEFFEPQELDAQSSLA